MAVMRPGRAIPSLDGLRAVSVGMVMLSHFIGWSTLPRHGALHASLAILGQGSLGVSTFFVISGFLITTLLLDEFERNGAIDLRSFYIRRFLRIFPPYYLFLVVAAAVAYFAGRPIPPITFATAALYLSNYYPYALSDPTGVGWYVGHTWSLSVEEQFYLLWPPVLCLLGPRRALKCGVAILIATPLLRLLTIWLLPSYALDEQQYRLFHTTIDVLMTGCVLAFLVRRPAFRARLERLFHPAVLGAACCYLAASSIIAHHTPSAFQALAGVTLTSVSIAILMLYVITRPDSLPGRLMNWAPLRHLGKISYSLYLWQQLFLGPWAKPDSPLMPALAVACAEASYWIVERPIAKLRSRFAGRAHHPEAPIAVTEPARA